MKTTFAVAIAANLLAIAYAAPGNGAKKAESSGDVSVFENEKGNTSIQISKTCELPKNPQGSMVNCPY